MESHKAYNIMFESRAKNIRNQVVSTIPYANRCENTQSNLNQLQTEMPRENPNNIPITRSICETILQNHGVDYKIKNLDLFQRAFVHTSYLIDDPNMPKSSASVTTATAATTATASTGPSISSMPSVPLQPISYERLEYIGDAILNAATAHYVFQRFPLEDEGFMTTLRTKLVRSKTLARITKKLKLHKYILLSLYTDKVINGRNNRNTLEDVFEAWIGALYTDSGPDIGFGICLRFITNVFEKWIDMVNMINRDDNYKKNLLEYYQKRFRTEAKYQIISVRGKKQHKIYTMGALSPTGEIIGIGQAKNKVDADQMASKQALIYYGEDVEESEEDSISE
jgi:ribonuclease-3